MNVGSIVDKYFSDTLVHAGILCDDHYGHILNVSFSFGGVRKMDGHAIATIYELVDDGSEQEDEEPMRILLDQDDIQAALEAYVDNMGIAGATGVTLTGTVEAEVQIGEPADKPKSKGGRPKGSRNKPKPPVEEETADAETDSDDGSTGTDTGTSEPEAENNQADAKVEPENPSSTEGAKNSSSIFGEEDEAVSEEKPARKAVKAGSSIFDE